MATTTKCPIDTSSCVVWALVSLFSRFINTNYYIKYVTWKAVTTRTGPNDAWHIVWAISKFFLSLFLVSLILTTIYRWKMWPGKWRWQEQAQITHHALFGPFISQFHHERHQEVRGEMTGQGGYHLHHHPYYRKRLEVHLHLEPLVCFLFLYISTTRRRVIPLQLAHWHQLTSGLQPWGIYPKHNLHVILI